MSDEQRIDYILESIWQIEEFIETATIEDFITDSKLKFACYGCVIIVSEAATKISKEKVLPGLKSKIEYIIEVLEKEKNAKIN